MFQTESWNINGFAAPIPGPMWHDIIWMLIGAAISPILAFAAALNGESGFGERLLTILALLYCDWYLLALPFSWYPVALRSRPRSLWFWRIGTLAMFWPLVWLNMGRPPPPGYGGPLWALGSIMIGAAAWIAPPKIPGEPRFAWTSLWRDLLRKSILNPQPSSDPPPPGNRTETSN